MDKRSHKRVVLFIGLLFLILLGGALAAVRWIDTVHTEELEMLGQCILLKPGTEGEYTAAFLGKNSVDRERALRTGREARDKYGYTERFRTFSPSLAAFLPVLISFMLFCTLLTGFLIFYQQKKRHLADIKIFDLEDKLAEMGEENQILRERMAREEAKTKTLVTDISHQLKTPLASLKMCYEIADSGSFTEEEQQTFLRQGIHEVNKLENLTKALVQISRLETNMIRVEGKMESLKKTIRGAVNSVYMKAFEKNITISVDEFEDEKIFQDPKWTQEALVNVLDNAVKYSPPGTEVELRVSSMVSCCLIEIEDQGIGIPKEEMHQVFQRFYRGDRTEVQDTEGSGVGLYLTRKILEDLGGSIRIRKGKRGSIFQISLPKTPYRAQK
ncbi:sensor histidine kinase [Lactonifactor longoviformis]|uniref:histidine kinase n=1 Tax=Lactonifactor longoviformis DSM 17459 TaxID=1122155 RepID=A0A1M4WFI9_9CLOT|nr:HAMP domain-containing sensor histidine kinase [Lactonifactor longoviformis]POP32667.1 sensor histidine kinase [Lactonifactor longoviformis]SHE79940.1 Signal transduction histidine kinase [Lactonifactor longoviformis DSM 17459]